MSRNIGDLPTPEMLQQVFARQQRAQAQRLRDEAARLRAEAKILENLAETPATPPGIALADEGHPNCHRSLIAETNPTPPCVPAIAGVKEPFHMAVERDKLDPQFRSYRAFMEMLYSGNLTRGQS